MRTAGNAEGVPVQAEGPYEAKAADGSWLMIYPEGQEPQFPLRSRTGLTAGRMLARLTSPPACSG